MISTLPALLPKASLGGDLLAAAVLPSRANEFHRRVVLSVRISLALYQGGTGPRAAMCSIQEIMQNA